MFGGQEGREAAAEIHYRGNALLRLLKYAVPYRKALFICMAAVLAATALDLCRPLILRNAIDQYITGPFAPGERAEERFAGLLRAGGLYLLCLAGLFLCNRTQFWLMQKTGQQIIEGLRNQLFAHVESLTMRFFDITPVGKIVTRLTNDVDAINDVFSNVLVRLFKNSVKILGLMAVMLALNAKAALVAFALVPVVAVLTFIFRRMSREAFQITRARLTDLNTYLSEHLSGMKLIQIFGREEMKFAEFREKNDGLFRAGWRELMINALFRPGLYLIAVLASVLLQGFCAGQVLGGLMTIGTLYAFIDYTESFFQPIQELAEQFATLQSAIASAEKIFTLLDTEPLLRDPADPLPLGRAKGRIEFDHVWFAYTGEDWVLKDVSFTIEPGQKAAFVGATGAGKSSILNLIGRYYDVQKGRILIDGKDIRELDRAELRASIGQVQQDVFIFTGDIADNIRLRNPEITDLQVREAAVEVNAARFIDRLPDGYRHPVTERGSTLSAGQRQLISFARALAHDPSILVLDEATSNIDTETEQWIQEAVERLMRGRTTIMVAHRLSTIQHADTIIVMHKGRIRESGNHQQLLAMDGIYKKLYRLQLSGQEEEAHADL